MTEKDFLEKKPNLEKYAVKNSYISDSVMNVVDPKRNKGLPYFYTEKMSQLIFIDLLTDGRVNGYYFF